MAGNYYSAGDAAASHSAGVDTASPTTTYDAARGDEDRYTVVGSVRETAAHPLTLVSVLGVVDGPRYAVRIVAAGGDDQTLAVTHSAEAR